MKNAAPGVDICSGQNRAGSEVIGYLEENKWEVTRKQPEDKRNSS